MVRRGSGFTLIELTMAIVLLAIGLLALTGALARALHETARARSVHAALRAAEGVVDSVAAVDVPAAGAIARPGFTLWWRPEACTSGECVRVGAIAGRDTLSILARAERPVR